eukprot:6198823-Pleurochrysis_carterae.AAC.2
MVWSKRAPRVSESTAASLCVSSTPTKRTDTRRATSPSTSGCWNIRSTRSLVGFGGNFGPK